MPAGWSLTKVNRGCDRVVIKKLLSASMVRWDNSCLKVTKPLLSFISIYLSLTRMRIEELLKGVNITTMDQNLWQNEQRTGHHSIHLLLKLPQVPGIPQTKCSQKRVSDSFSLTIWQHVQIVRAVTPVSAHPPQTDWCHQYTLTSSMHNSISNIASKIAI
jgi:hypothetical protein